MASDLDSNLFPKISIFHLIAGIKTPLGWSPELPLLLKWVPQTLRCQLNSHPLGILFLPSVCGDKDKIMICTYLELIFLQLTSFFTIIICIAKGTGPYSQLFFCNICLCFLCIMRFMCSVCIISCYFIFVFKTWYVFYVHYIISSLCVLCV